MDSSERPPRQRRARSDQPAEESSASSATDQPSLDHPITDAAVGRILEAVGPKHVPNAFNRARLAEGLEEARRRYLAVLKAMPKTTPRERRKQLSALQRAIQRLLPVLPAGDGADSPLVESLRVAEAELRSRGHICTADLPSCAETVDDRIERLRSDARFLLSLAKEYFQKEKEYEKLTPLNRIQFLMENETWREMFVVQKERYPAEHELVNLVIPYIYDMLFGPTRWGKLRPSRADKYTGPAVRFAKVALFEMGVKNPVTGRPFDENEIGERWDRYLPRHD